MGRREEEMREAVGIRTGIGISENSQQYYTFSGLGGVI
jgi:hypothetical protein